MPKIAYTFVVTILSGPMDEKFCKKNPVLSRTIRIGGDYTLNVLHHAIFEAFDREEEHLYEFQFGGKRPMDRNARRFTVLFSGDDLAGAEMDSPGDAVVTMIRALELKPGDRFFYWFDFGDDWHHEIKVKEIGEVMAKDAKPKVIARVGKSPPQYPDFEEEQE